MSLSEAKLPNLKQKLEEKAVLEKEIEKVDDTIEELTNPKKVKVVKNKK